MDKNGVGIRPMEESDLEFVRSGLSETNWQDIPEDQRRHLNRQECDKRVFEDFERYRKEERFKFRVFVAVANDERRVGYVSVGESMNPAVGLRLGAILDFWVSPEFRGRGTGGRLLDHAMEYIRNRGYSHCSILASANNAKALRSYEERGFHPDRIVLVKPLK